MNDFGWLAVRFGGTVVSSWRMADNSRADQSRAGRASCELFKRCNLSKPQAELPQVTVSLRRHGLDADGKLVTIRHCA